MGAPVSGESQSGMPVQSIGHGSPRNGIEDNDFGRAWENVGREVARPRAVFRTSAHWETDGPHVTAMEWPKTNNDFYGFHPDQRALPADALRYSLARE